MSVPSQMKYVGLLGLVAGLGLTLGPASAQPKNQKLTTTQAKKAYADLKTQADKGYARTQFKEVTINNQKVKVYQGNAPRLNPVDPMGGGPNPPPPVQMCVKVWAELSDPAGTKSGQFVNIELYKWKPKQQFYFWVESAVPINLSLFQNYDVGLAEARPPKLVSPDPKFPLTYSTCEAGVPFRFPQLFETDLNLREEFVTLTVIAAGASVPVGPGPNPPVIQQPLNDPNAGMVINNNTLVNQTNVFVSQNPGPLDAAPMGGGSRSFRAKDREGQRMGPVNPELPPGANPQTFASPDGNVVAMFAIGSQNIGHLPLRFSK